MTQLRWFLTSLLICQLAAEPLQIRFPYTGDLRHQYFAVLIEEALNAVGTPVSVLPVTVPRHMRSYLALQNGDIDVMWLLPSKARDSQLHRVDIPLTKGLIGQRVMLINKGDSRFSTIKNLPDLQKTRLVAGLGRGWRDVSIWESNQLPYYEHNGDWNDIYRLLASKKRGVDYFPRGATEVLEEASAHPELMIEPSLVLRYKADFYYYTRDPTLASKLYGALSHAQQSGLFDQLHHQYFDPLVNALQLDKRQVIVLDVPDEKQ